MRKKGNINYVGILLAILYIFSSSSYILFHHHNSQHIVYTQANPCEKSIYFTDKDQGCQHNEHFTQHVKKCPMCDHHTLSIHTLLPHSYSSLNRTDNNEYLSKYNNDFDYTFLEETPNKDPPVTT